MHPPRPPALSNHLSTTPEPVFPAVGWGKGTGGWLLTSGRGPENRRTRLVRKGRSLGASCFGRFSPAELPASGPHFPLNTPPKQSFSQTFPCCLTLTSSGPRDKPTSPKSYNSVPRKLSMPPSPADHIRSEGGQWEDLEWEADCHPFPSSSSWCH